MGFLGAAVSGCDVDFRELKEGRASVYLVIPQDRIATHGAWLVLVTRQAIAAVARSSGQSEVLFVLDEFANMGKLAGLAESLTALPGLGVRVCGQDSEESCPCAKEGFDQVKSKPLEEPENN